jgi:uncharacterized circularly permuted ATP-grasp superfamily protein/uncharacterized alpha-E superfamily protein
MAGRFDECVDAGGRLRGHWEAFFGMLGADPAAALAKASDSCRRIIVEQDVSMNVYAGERSAEKTWPLDALPLLVSASDWEAISAGLRQRARLYHALLRDLYGPQRFLRSGLLPAGLAMANPRYLRACANLGRSRSVFLHTYAADIARSPDGRWWVLDDRLDAPSGMGYSVQNRIIVRQAMPAVFQRAPVQRLYKFLRNFRVSVDQAAPGRDERRVVVLTPGPANETYFEHAYLAHYLGYPLVEGADLVTRDHQVYLRTVGGLKRVDAIVRRVDSEFCDPLELNSNSLLGIPGLTEAAQRGRVAIANQLGCGALEGSAILAFLDPLCRAALGEDLRLPSVATWWCGQPSARDYVLKHLPDLVVKPAFRTLDAPPVRYGALLDEAERSALARDIEARPWAYCGQERVFLGTTPAMVDREVRPVPFTVRVFLAWSDGDYQAMPGGFTRFNPTGEDGIVSLQQGSITKDTWVLTDGAVEPPPPLTLRPGPAPDPSFATATSRVADNLFWLGRYLERAAQQARMLEKLDPLLRDEIAVLDPDVATAAAAMLVEAQGLTAPAGRAFDELAATAQALAADPDKPGTLAAGVANLRRVADQIKILLPPEAWKRVRELGADGAGPGPSSELTKQLSALEALTLETMPHDIGWRFLELGRRIERSQQLVFMLRHLLVAPHGSEIGEFRLQTVLHFSDSLFMYRSARHGSLRPETVLGWLVKGEDNPRGLRYQAEQISLHLDRLPAELAPAAVSALRLTAFRLLASVRLMDPSGQAKAGGFLAETASTLASLSDQITQVYFAHAAHVEQAAGAPAQRPGRR